jgi:hypothetical protein
LRQQTTRASKNSAGPRQKLLSLDINVKICDYFEGDEAFFWCMPAEFC